MRTRIFIIVLLNVVSNANGQIYFDRLYQSGAYESSLEGFWGTVKKYDDGYVFASYSRPLNNMQRSDIWVGMTDDYGEIIHDRLYGQDGQVHAPTGLVEEGGFYYVLSTFGDNNATTPNDQYLLSCFDQDLDLLWSRVYGDTNRSEYANEIIAPSTGLLIVGQSSDSTISTSDMYIVRTDLQGNEIFSKYYGGSNWDAALSAIETPDSGFLLLGWTRSYGAGQRDFYLVKTDSLGNQEWQRTYGGGGDEGGFDILRLSDSNYLLTGAGSQGSSTSIGRLYKIRPDGIVLWAKTYLYPGNSGNNLYKTIEMPNGDLVSVGLTDRNNNNNGGWLVRTDSEGNVLWHREYNKNELTDLFYSVLPTDDGGFLLSGQAMNLDNSSQDAWLLKVDSIGCPYPNCLVGVDEVEKSKVVVDVWPNPVSEVLNVQWHTAHPSTPLRVTFTDMLGRSYSPPAQEVQGVVGPYMQYDVSTFENGLYLLTIIQNESKTTLRVVVQH